MTAWTPGYLSFSVQLVPKDMGLPPGNWTINLSMIIFFYMGIVHTFCLRIAPNHSTGACEGECGSKHEHSAVFSSVDSWLYWSQDTHKPYPVHRLPTLRR
jgi:hypothetical protein